MVGRTISCMMCLWPSRLMLVVGETSPSRRVRALVPVEGTLVVLHRSHRHHAGAVGKDEERHLLAVEELLHHDLRPGGAEPLLRHDLVDHLLRLGGVLDDDRALAGGETVRLHHDG